MNFMLQTRTRRFALYALTIVSAMVVSCLVLGVVGYNSNRGLPVSPQVSDRMEPLDKNRLSEALHLKAGVGEAVWPGFSKLEPPVIIWNEQTEFLFVADQPPDGWEVVPDDDFQEAAYFRRPADDPQNFAVSLGEGWAASVFTKQALDARLIQGVRGLLPPVISEIFPYRIFIRPSELQISGVQHETFHVFQAVNLPVMYARAEGAYEYDETYWAADAHMRDAWDKEVGLLIDAVEASTNGDAATLARQFLVVRDQRRLDHDLNTDLVAYETHMEWLEGTAKYVELRFWEQAGSDPGYTPLPEMAADPDFNGYENFKGHWNQEMRQTRRQAGVEGDVRFYYTGMLQAYLLDRLEPGWKEKIMEDGANLESLLREALWE